MKTRADQLLFELGHAQSRSKAKDLILNKQVFHQGKLVTKASQEIDSTELEVKTSETYVSRGAYKLQSADQVFSLDFKDKVIADIGASTGGFTDYALSKGAKKVFAIDVGHGQLDPKLQKDSRVINLEKTNIRHMTDWDEPVDMIVSDLSFISLSLVLKPMLKILKTTGELVLLFKPQFEVGKENIGKNGIVKDRKLIEDALKAFLDLCRKSSLEVIGSTPSQITGRGGNQEYLIYLRRSI